MSKYNPVIVVVAYNRPHSLERLLFSLKNAKKIINTKLIISIDNKEPDNLNVKQIADAFEWPFGEKEVIYQKQRLGLRKHVLQCGDFASQYGSVIILEDDLFVSPYFYDYAINALNNYVNDERIAGISLYSQPREEASQKPFTSLSDNSDVFFLQFPSSYGLAWTQNQWENFKKWYIQSPIIDNIHLPDRVFSWPETSWKKYFCSFLVKMNKFVVFPKQSLTTNFNDPGTNITQKVNHDGQAQLRLINTNYRFIGLDESYCIYDVYLEILPECINKLVNHLNDFDYELDLYGLKNLKKIVKPFIITSRPVINSIRSFKRALKPHEMNIIFNLKGDDLHLCRKEDIKDDKSSYSKKISDYKYFYHKRLVGFRTLLYYHMQQLFHD